MRYRLDCFFARTGMRDPLALPLKQFFHSSGYASASCITASTIFSLERVCEGFLRYRLDSFFARAGTRDHLALPLRQFFHSSGYARSSCVTASAIISLERVCEAFQRYLSLTFSKSSGMMDAPALPFSYLSTEFGYAGRSNVTFLLPFHKVWARWTLQRYLSLTFPQSSGTLDAPTLPFSYLFKEFGHGGRSSVTFLLPFHRVRARWTLQRYHSPKTPSSSSMQGHLT